MFAIYHMLPKNMLGVPEIEGLALLVRVAGVKVEEGYPQLYGQLSVLPDKFTINLED